MKEKQKRPNRIIITWNYNDYDIETETEIAKKLCKELKKFITDPLTPLSTENKDENIAIFWK